MRQCVWCEADITADGAAVPLLYSRTGPDECDWQCTEPNDCFERQAAMQEAINWPDYETFRGRRVEDALPLIDYL